jgi:hypothetical protein
MPSERPQPPAANDNRVGDESFIVRNLVSAELTYTLAIFTRDEGAP